MAWKQLVTIYLASSTSNTLSEKILLEMCCNFAMKQMVMWPVVQLCVVYS